MGFVWKQSILQYEYFETWKLCFKTKGWFGKCDRSEPQNAPQTLHMWKKISPTPVVLPSRIDFYSHMQNSPSAEEVTAGTLNAEAFQSFADIGSDLILSVFVQQCACECAPAVWLGSLLLSLCRLLMLLTFSFFTTAELGWVVEVALRLVVFWNWAAWCLFWLSSLLGFVWGCDLCSPCMELSGRFWLPADGRMAFWEGLRGFLEQKSLPGSMVLCLLEEASCPQQCMLAQEAAGSSSCKLQPGSAVISKVFALLAGQELVGYVLSLQKGSFS